MRRISKEHMNKLFNTPEKKARAEKIMNKARKEKELEMEFKGYKRKGNQFIKYK